MESNFQIKKLFRVALYSSTLIGLITMGPIYAIVVSSGIISISNLLLLKLIIPVVIGISFFVFLFWTINILLGYLIYKYSISHRERLWSYVIGFFIIVLLRYIVINLHISHEILNWKIHEFGTNIKNVGLISQGSHSFPYLIIALMTFSINTVVFIFYGIINMAEEKRLIESENNLLKIKNIEASNQLLKQQLHPHFLFNSLSTLKTLIKKQPDNAEKYVMRLADFLRASISMENINTIKLTEELKLCKDFLEMQKMRFGDALQYEECIPEENKSGYVPVFSIQLLLENAIKHNVLTDQSPLHIIIAYDDKRIIVSNTLKAKYSSETSTGLGLANLSERYKLLSGDEIIICSSEHEFSVSIKILDNETINHRG